MKLSAIAEHIGARLDGADVEITGVVGIEEAGPGQLTFVANPKYAAATRDTKASAVIVDDKFPALSISTLRTKNPYLAFAHALELFYAPLVYAPGVHPTAVIHATAKLGANASVGPYVVIDQDVTIGDNAVLLAHAVIYRGARIGNHFFAHAHSVVREFCQLGDNVILQNGAVIGADGFGFAKNDRGEWHKIVQSGPAILEDEVEVQANACIDRATVGETRIKRGAKIDNLVQVGHACTVGENTMLCAQVGLAGSSVIGKNVILAGQVGVAGHLTIGDGAIATAQSGIPNDVSAGALVSGYPAIDNRQWLRSVAIYNRLPELMRELRARRTAKPEQMDSNE
jgi:UDP-3-O-[3-hydroxymyristoyl] glucosamine N-acyltransferase